MAAQRTILNRPIAPAARWETLALGALWASIQLALYRHFGPHTAIDSALYIANAQRLLQGEFRYDSNFWYSGYSAFLAVVWGLGGGVRQAVWLQIALSGGAALALWQAVHRLSGAPRTAYLAVLFYLLWFKIHQWNMILYTESLFTSCCIFSFALLVLARRRWQVGLAGLLIGYTALVRPSGYCFLLGVAAYGVVRLRRTTLNPAAWWLLAGGVGVGLLLLLNKMLASYILVESYARAEIIYPGLTLGLQPPAALVLPAATLPPLVRLLAFVASNPLYFCKLAVIKLLLFISNVKPYFSWRHNLAITLVLWPLYYFAFRGGQKLLLRHAAATGFIVAFAGAQAITVALTTENWDGRFLIPVLPFVFTLAALGLRPGRLAAFAPDQ